MTERFKYYPKMQEIIDTMTNKRYHCNDHKLYLLLNELNNYIQSLERDSDEII